MKILYFTSTGNSLCVARRFSENPLSIVQLILSDEYEISDEEAIGIIVPDHVCDIPEPVRYYLEKATLEAPYKFAVITYGSGYAAAPERLLELQSMDYLETLLMVDNYFPVFNQKEQVDEAWKKETDQHLAGIIFDVTARRHFLRLSDDKDKEGGDKWREHYVPMQKRLIY